MEMDSGQLKHNGDCIEASSGKPSPEPPDPRGVFGHPEILARFGERYQVEIPPLMAKSDYLSLTNNPADAEIKAGFPHGFLMGLPIPIVWIDQESDNITETHIYSKGKNKKVEAEPSDTALDGGIRLGTSTNLDLQKQMENKGNQKYRGKGCCLVPGALCESWNHMEEASFLLGLYIFGKNLVQVKRFIETKGMGDILAFYYGKFYRSGKYRRWSECVKKKSRRCVYGQKIFVGVRQQALLSRLLPHVSVEHQNTLLEVSKTFLEGKILLEQYVFTLKDMVGMKSLIEAVGIGKGKRDLTGISMEPLKSDQVAPVRPEIPIGKACSKLTNGEIINFLTGGFRLSKARSSDLFWEAVWPRLLAKGWHSEQPDNLGRAAGSKHSLVFLVPGVGKFSRRKLVKGNHYFDSVTDLLNKVASDPDLLELEIEADNGNRIEEDNGLTNEMKLDQNGLSDQQHHCYLRPRTPNCNAELVEFTVVDTSLIDGENCKLREVRHLPLPTSSTSTSAAHTKISHFSEEGADVLDSASTLLSLNQGVTFSAKTAETMFGKGVSCGQKNCEDSALNQALPINGPGSCMPTKTANDQNTNLCDGKKPRNAIKCTKPHNSSSVAPVAKRRRGLTACGRTEKSNSTSSSLRGSRLKQKPAHDSENADSSKNILSQVDPSETKVFSATSSLKNRRAVSSEGIPYGTSLKVKRSHEKPQRRRRLTACSRTVTNHRTSRSLAGSTSKKEEHQDSLKNPDFSKSILLQVNPSQEKPSLTTSSKNSHMLSTENMLSQIDPSPKNSDCTSSSKRSQIESGEFILSQVDPCQEESSITSSKNNQNESSENILLQVDPSQNKSAISSSKNNQVESREGILCGTSVSAQHSDEKLQRPMVIDLNIPLSVDAETDEVFMMQAAENQDHQTNLQPDDSNALETSVIEPSPQPDNSNALEISAIEPSSEQKPSMNSRRQSTRNRPPTARALEAFAGGFFNIKRRRKRAEVFPKENQASEPPRCRRRHKAGLTENSGLESVNSIVEEEGNGMCNNTGIMLNQVQVQSEIKGA